MQNHDTTYGSTVSLDSIASTLHKARRSGDGIVACCPAHEDSSPSLYIRVGNEGKLLWRCLAGCDQLDVGRALGILDGDFTFIDNCPKVADLTWKKDLINRLWSEAKPIEPGDPVHLYLTENRKISITAISDLRFHPGLEYRELDENKKSKVIGVFPAMVAAVRDLSNDLLAIHRTYLTATGKKISIERPELKDKMLLGSLAGGAVHLYQSNKTLAIAEGLETSAAMACIFNCPAWSAISSAGLSNVVIPDSIEHLIIGVDNDTAGEKAAAKLHKRYINTIAKISIARASRLLDRPNADWADILKDKETK